MYIDDLRSACAAEGIKYRATAGEKTLEKKLQNAGAELPEKVEVAPEIKKASFNDDFSQVQELDERVRELGRLKDADGKPYVSPEMPLAKKKLSQAHEALLVKIKESEDRASLKRYLVWARSRKVGVNRHDEQILNRMEYEDAQGEAECIHSGLSNMKISLGDEVRFSKVFDEGRGMDLFSFYHTRQISPFAQIPKAIQEKKIQGFHIDPSEYPPEYTQYHRFQLTATEFRKYFKVVVDV